MHNSLSIDEIIKEALTVCERFDNEHLFVKEKQQLSSLMSRLYRGEIHIAVIGQFNRGKSTFINKLLQVDLLPASVLPLTSLSTQIVYRENQGYHLTFHDGTELDEETSAEAIQQVLVDYVAESSNPKNHKGVRNVKVGCPCELLHHGTRIIDTPGFGSTHIHNTKATLELLKECDAVLFMLSADLPITQIELNFLKRIRPHVTRLFFIYNKKDLLNDQELQETTHFIQETLRNQLQIESRDNFFTISARDAEEDRVAAGITNIEENILGFLQREKYFSLAEAIDKKLKETLASIRETFNSKLAEVSEKQKEEQRAIDALENELTHLHNEFNRSEESVALHLEAYETTLLDFELCKKETLKKKFYDLFDHVTTHGKNRSFNEIIPHLQSETALLFFQATEQIRSTYEEELQTLANDLFTESAFLVNPSLDMKTSPTMLPEFYEEQREGFLLFKSSKQRLHSITNLFEDALDRAILLFIEHLQEVIQSAVAQVKEDLTLSLRKKLSVQQEGLEREIKTKKDLTQKSKARTDSYTEALEALPQL